jgi:hypothetical protein
MRKLIFGLNQKFTFCFEINSSFLVQYTTPIRWTNGINYLIVLSKKIPPLSLFEEKEGIQGI